MLRARIVPAKYLPHCFYIEFFNGKEFIASSFSGRNFKTRGAGEKMLTQLGFKKPARKSTRKQARS